MDQDLEVTLLVDGSSGDKQLEYEIATVLQDMFYLFKDRQRKYGPGNIAAFGEHGVVVRANDKLARLRHFYFEDGAENAGDESVADAWNDLAVYGAIARVCMKGKWPGATPSKRSTG